MTISEMRVITPVVITDAMLTSSSIAETDYAAWSSGTTYASGAYVIVTSSGVHRVYQSLQAGNLNKDPTSAANAAWWAEVGPTNRWKMFDQAAGTVSTDSSSIDVTLAPGRIDSVALLDVDCYQARIRMSTVADGTFYDRTWTLTGATDIVADWYDYFYAPIGQRTTLAVTGLPAIGDASVRVTLTRSGGTVSLGSLVVGSSTYLGRARYDMRLGIIDYSVKSTDGFGRTTVVQRPFAKRANLDVLVATDAVGALAAKLASLRATLGVWIAGNAETTSDALKVYGWFKDWEVSLSGPTYSALSLQIEGIT